MTRIKPRIKREPLTCKHPSTKKIESKEVHRWCKTCGALYCFISPLGWTWLRTEDSRIPSKPKVERAEDSRGEESWTKPVTAGQALKEFHEECARDELISTKRHKV